MKLTCTLLLSMIAGMLNIGVLKGQEPADLQLAKSYFDELDSLCRIDNGNLWGINLYGATMFVFPKSRLIIANQADKAENLVEKEGLFVGMLPDNVNIANTSMEWNGTSWTMVNWEDIPAGDKYSRAKLLIHESWHRNEEVIGIKPVMTENTHLDELQGSVLLKLEFLALSHALMSQAGEKTTHLTNALNIRAYRQLLFPANNENTFELHEGMAEYTGFRLCGINRNLLPKVVLRQLEISMEKEGLANSFAYLTGPAYGVLFDDLKEGWIDEVKPGKSLPEIGSQIINKKPATDTAVLRKFISELIKLYEADTLIANENRKFETQQQLTKEYEHTFLESDVLIIRNNNLQFVFNPHEKLIPVGNGVVYKTMRLTGEWGIAEVANGIFRANDWQFFMLPAPVSQIAGKITEPDYTILLNEGWEVVEVKEGKYTIIKK